ncbi:MAG: O-antigen ligase family protein [Cyclobacteriaceae bacterium]
MASKKNKAKSKNNKPQPKEVVTTKKKQWAINNKLNWLIALIVILPFIYSRKSMEPALSPRFIFESAFLGLYHIYFFALRGEKYFLKLPKLSFQAFLLMTGFVLWSVLASISVTNFGESLYEVSRNFLNLLLFFTVIHAVITEKLNTIVLCRWVAFAALIHAFIGFDENFVWGYTKFPGGASPHGLMANRNLFGSAQALVLPLVLFLIYKDKGIGRGFGIFSAMLVVGSIYISQTRAAYISTALLVTTIFVLVVVFLPELRKRTALIGAVVCVGYLLTLGYIKFDEMLEYRPRKGKVSNKIEQSKQEKKSPDTKLVSMQPKDSTTEVMGKLESWVGNSESIKERIVVWSESIGIIKDNPFMGVGPGNWKVTVPKYRIGGIRNDYGKIVRIRPHNIYVQVITENGIVGFIFYYGCWMLVLVASIQVLLRSRDNENKLIVIMLMAGFVSFTVDGFFSFPLERYEHTMFLHVMMGIALGLYALQNGGESLVKSSKLSRLLVVPIVAFLGWNIFLGIERHTFEYHMNRAKVFQKRKQNEKIVREAEAGKSKWISLDPNKDPLEIQSAMALKNIGKSFKDKKDEPQSSKYYQLAMVEAKQALAYSPHSTRNLNTLGTIYTETQQYDSAIATYKKALFYAPYYEVTLKNLALNYLYSKDYKSCLETMSQFKFEGDEYFEKVHKVATYRLAQEEKGTANQKD